MLRRTPLHFDPLVLYRSSRRIATLTLNRPKALNSIVDETGAAIADAVERANNDDDVRVIVVQGAGRGFCSGYDLLRYAETPGFNMGFQEMPWDPIKDYKMMKKNTNDFMSLWRSLKPVIAKVHGPCVGGGSDIALCCDLVVAADDAKIGYPPSILWGCPTTFHWVQRLGAEKAKYMLLTGETVSGKEASDMGLILKSAPAEKLDEEVERLAKRIARAPSNQTMMQKIVVNNAVEAMGLGQTQTLATLMDGISRHTPEGVAFKQQCEKEGWKKVVAKRDSAPPFEDDEQ